MMADDLEESAASASDDGKERPHNGAQMLALLRTHTHTHSDRNLKDAIGVTCSWPRRCKHSTDKGMHGQRITTCTPRANDHPSQKAKGEVDPRSNFEGRGFGPHRNKSVIENLRGKPRMGFCIVGLSSLRPSSPGRSVAWQQ